MPIEWPTDCEFVKDWSFQWRDMPYEERMIEIGAIVRMLIKRI